MRKCPLPLFLVLIFLATSLSVAADSGDQALSDYTSSLSKVLTRGFKPDGKLQAPAVERFLESLTVENSDEALHFLDQVIEISAQLPSSDQLNVAMSFASLSTRLLEVMALPKPSYRSEVIAKNLRLFLVVNSVEPLKLSQISNLPDIAKQKAQQLLMVLHQAVLEDANGTPLEGDLDSAAERVSALLMTERTDSINYLASLARDFGAEEQGEFSSEAGSSPSLNAGVVTPVPICPIICVPAGDRLELRPKPGSDPECQSVSVPVDRRCDDDGHRISQWKCAPEGAPTLIVLEYPVDCFPKGCDPDTTTCRDVYACISNTVWRNGEHVDRCGSKCLGNDARAYRNTRCTKSETGGRFAVAQCEPFPETYLCPDNSRCIQVTDTETACQGLPPVPPSGTFPPGVPPISSVGNPISSSDGSNGKSSSSTGTSSSDGGGRSSSPKGGQPGHPTKPGDPPTGNLNNRCVESDGDAKVFRRNPAGKWSLSSICRKRCLAPGKGAAFKPGKCRSTGLSCYVASAATRNCGSNKPLCVRRPKVESLDRGGAGICSRAK